MVSIILGYMALKMGQGRWNWQDQVQWTGWVF